jgi:hypothetical protein
MAGTATDYQNRVSWFSHVPANYATLNRAHPVLMGSYETLDKLISEFSGVVE